MTNQRRVKDLTALRTVFLFCKDPLDPRPAAKIASRRVTRPLHASRYGAGRAFRPEPATGPATRGRLAHSIYYIYAVFLVFCVLLLRFFSPFCIHYSWFYSFFLGVCFVQVRVVVLVCIHDVFLALSLILDFCFFLSSFFRL